MNDKVVETRKFGTFLGVYVPSVLTILGLVMYLRFGWVVGNLGLGLTIVTVILASSITFITGLSASAIATNIKVGVGGEYYLVSRSLGLEPGGAIGIPLYLCRTLSVTFYCFGLAEALLFLWPADWGPVPGYMVQLVAAFFIVTVTLLSGKSAALVLKAQIPIMILLILSLLALVTGVLTNDMHTPLWKPTFDTAPEGYWYVFAVFFPAVTGFTAGIGLSGDLKDPGRSIPKGTLGAVITGVVVYLIVPLLLSVTALLTIEELADSGDGLQAWTNVAIFGGLFIYPAVWGAVLSSAFGSILGGPRVLQALSMDGLAPAFLSRLSKTGQPTIATWISGAIALVAVALGGLNTVAQFVSVLFLTLYVAINLSAALETLVAEPSYRPRIKVAWYISLAGAVGAIGVMYLISPTACVVALLLELLIFIWLRSRALEQRWGDLAAGFWMNLSRFALVQLDNRRIHPRNWRPFMLLFIKDIDTRMNEIRLAAALGQNHGMLTIAKLLRESEEELSGRRRNFIELKMRRTLKRLKLTAFCEVHSVNDVFNGMLEVAKGHGVANLRTNTIAFGWSEDRTHQVKILELIHQLSAIGKNVVMMRFNQNLPTGGNRIDIWWGGRQNNGDLMLLLAFMLKLNTSWQEAVIRIRSMVRTESAKLEMEKGILEIMPSTRITAEVLVEVSDTHFIDFVRMRSQDADIVLLGMPDLIGRGQSDTMEWIERLSEKLKVAIFVKNNGSVDVIPQLLKI